jgi:hypothetical protein
MRYEYTQQPRAYLVPRTATPELERLASRHLPIDQEVYRAARPDRTSRERPRAQRRCCFDARSRHGIRQHARPSNAGGGNQLKPADVLPGTRLLR